MRSALTLLFLLTLALPALATDGVVQINQTCAVQTGCFPGDGAGFPVTIATGGSYRLTSGLDISSTTQSGITVQADDVSIDLNGFAITGQGDGQKGIDRFSSLFSNTTVVNGTIRDIAFGGISLGPGSRVEGVRVLATGGVGINVGEGGIVAGCTVDGNDVAGISFLSGTSTNGLAVRNVVRNHTGFGIFGGAHTGNVMTNNSSSSNGIQIGTNQCGTNTTCP